MTVSEALAEIEALPLCRELFSEVNPIPVKAALNLMGWNVGSPRLPLTELEEHHRVSLEKALREYGCME